jgi:glycosyltransferase involved in cell wall biosynthesis
MMNCSICICTYNGEAYIDEQIVSILSQISLYDEVIVIDDCSSDSTVNLIENYCDARIKIIVNQYNLGPVKSFEKALQLAKNNLIFLSDQDDIWKGGRYELMKMTLLNSDALLLTSKSDFIGKKNEFINFQIDGVFENESNNYKRNIFDIFVGKTNYYGCCMILKREIINTILPIPSFVESHDLWIAMCANMLKKNIHIEESTLYRRIHGNNASVISRSIIKKVYSRFVFVLQVFVIYKRLMNKL